MSYSLTKVPKTQYQVCNAFISLAPNPEEATTILFFGGRGSAGTDANKLANDAGVTKRIVGGWDTSTMNYHTMKTEQLNVFAFQDPTGAPWPIAVDFTMNWLRNGEDIIIGSTRYVSPKIKFDWKKVVVTGLSFGGGADFLYAGLDQEHANKVKAVAAIAPQSDILMKNHPGLPGYSPETAVKYLVNADVPVWFYTGDQDGFEDNANQIEVLMKAAGGNVLNQLAKGLGHSSGVWEPFYAGKIMRAWAGKQMNFYEWAVYITQGDSTGEPPVDPPVPPDPIIFNLKDIKKATVETTDGRIIIFQ